MRERKRVRDVLVTFTPASFFEGSQWTISCDVCANRGGAPGAVLGKLARQSDAMLVANHHAQEPRHLRSRKVLAEYEEVYGCRRGSGSGG